MVTESKQNIQNVFRAVCHGNDAFVSEKNEDYFHPHTCEQCPSVTLVTCCDSRVQLTAIIDDAINEVFGIENIGNQILPSEGSVDYGIFHLHTPVLLILGHTDCGAIKAYSSDYSGEPDSIKGTLNYLCEGLPKNTQFDELSIIQRVQLNVDYQVRVAMKKYAKEVDSGELVIVGAVYDFRNEYDLGYGRLIFININGESDSDTVKSSVYFNAVKEDIKSAHVKRL